ncbi:MAG: hypothetical protein ACR2M1_11475, partial [Gemmatimonadaceae bacterium]
PPSSAKMQMWLSRLCRSSPIISMGCMEFMATGLHVVRLLTAFVVVGLNVPPRLVDGQPLPPI